jgi:hypothetical protein
MIEFAKCAVRNRSRLPVVGVTCSILAAALATSFAQDDFALPLPAGVRAVWDISKAYRETTSTREKICINGLWRWQPAQPADEQVPGKNWGYFKVPGNWPGITDYMQKDFQTVHPHPSWAGQRLGSVSAAWYERTISIPSNWDRRRTALSVDYLNSYAGVFLDGTKVGELRFPGGEIDLTAHVRPGQSYVLSLFVLALPLKGVLLSYTDSNSAREMRGKVERRGLCGDVFLVSTPAEPRIVEMKVETSVRKSTLTVEAALEGLAPAAGYVLGAQIKAHGRFIREFKSRQFRSSDLNAGRFSAVESWKPDALWDLHTPTNQYELEVSLLDERGNAVDTYFRTTFGYREFWIDGRDFYLNGSRIFLCALPLDNAQVGAALATYDAARESLERLKSIGINFVYTHNYGCEPGAHLSFDGILRAADDVGMLVALSQPHFSHYEWRSSDAEQTNGYAPHARFYTGIARNHPSVVAYAMSHNATGYEQDMNPDMIDGLQEPRDRWSQNNAKLALRAEAIVKRLDPSRIVYHHASGNLGSMHSINFYPNFAPVQELSDWFEHWATEGVKPAFTCEYGAPFTWDWTMYRGWFKGERNFGSAEVPWEFCLAEWNAQFIGDRAFQISAGEATNLRWEAKQFRAGRLWHRWDYPHSVGSTVFDERYPIFAAYFNDNWRAFRTWGVSGISPWEHEHFWKLRPGLDKRRRESTTDWDNLQQPGFSPDYVERTYERMDLAYERSDWAPTEAAQALLRNNRPLLAWLAGGTNRFTSKDHIFFPGETVEKQLIVINNSRQAVTCDGEWSLALPERRQGAKRFRVATGQQERVPLRFELPEDLAPGRYELQARARFDTGETQTDSFVVNVLARPRPRAPVKSGPVALFDPKGETAQWLSKNGVKFQTVTPTSDLSGFDTFVVGKAALTPHGPAPNITRVREGLKVVMFEQTAEVLERRFGFRVAEYGLRQVFPRVPDHPALAGISPDHWRDWRGEATILPPRLEYTLRPRYGPTVKWCDLPVPRLWRCGNRGNVASVLIEKPACGDFLPILDGGYALQYSPLMEYREGRGMILFCQLDVNGRTEPEPVVEVLTRNILQYVANWKPAPIRTALYVGDANGRRHLESAGFALGSYQGGKISTIEVLIIGPKSGRELARARKDIDEWLSGGGHLVALGFDQQDTEVLGMTQISFTNAEHIATFFPSSGVDSLFRGAGPGDVHNRDPREIPLVMAGALRIGNGVLARANERNVVFCQLVPWQFDPGKQSNLKRTFRRTSYLVTRLLGNVGIASATPILERFETPVDSAKSEKRWLSGLYLDSPEEWDDPYRFFRW